MKPMVFDSSKSSSFEHDIDSSFEESCISMSEHIPCNPKKLTVYEFLSRAKYLKNKFKPNSNAD